MYIHHCTITVPSRFVTRADLAAGRRRFVVDHADVGRRDLSMSIGSRTILYAMCGCHYQSSTIPEAVGKARSMDPEHTPTVFTPGQWPCRDKAVCKVVCNICACLVLLLPNREGRVRIWLGCRDLSIAYYSWSAARLATIGRVAHE